VFPFHPFSTFHFRTKEKKIKTGRKNRARKSPRLSSSSADSSLPESAPIPPPSQFDAPAATATGRDNPGLLPVLRCPAWIGFSFSRAYFLGKETLA
jgi:hypothetical protein